MINNAQRVSLAGAALCGLMGWSAAVCPAQAYTEKVLNGAVGFPYTPVLKVGDTFYGESLLGGDLTCNAPNGCGTVFQMNRHGHETVLYSFTGAANGDGAYAAGPIIRDAQGNLYGTTEGGGTNCDGSGAGCGTVFKIDPSGKETVLYAFTDTYGAQGPNSGVVRDNSGNLYGTTYSGGTGNHGSIFEIDASGTYTLLHSFTGAENDGNAPNLAPLIIDNKGNLYGVTAFGGSTGWGAVYKFATSTSKLTILYSFLGGTDGCYPMGALLRDGKGTFYGTTNGCGSTDNGVVYKLVNGVQTVLFSVPSGNGGPYGAGVVMDKAGNLYGTTSFGGANLRGSVFKIDTAGNETDLYSFTGGADGDSPWAPVTLDAKGNIYGTTVYGGTSGTGVFFKLTP